MREVGASRPPRDRGAPPSVSLAPAVAQDDDFEQLALARRHGVLLFSLREREKMGS
jgi:hypothetical protein